MARWAPALESRKLGYLLDSDVIVPHKDELLFVAISEARPWPPAAGVHRTRSACSPWGRTIKAQLVNMRDGFISAYDFKIGAMIAEVVCGGDVDAGSMVSEGIPAHAGAQGVLPPDRTAQDARSASWACCLPASLSGIDDAP